MNQLIKVSFSRNHEWKLGLYVFLNFILAPLHTLPWVSRTTENQNRFLLDFLRSLKCKEYLAWGPLIPGGTEGFHILKTFSHTWNQSAGWTGKHHEDGSLGTCGFCFQTLHSFHPWSSCVENAEGMKSKILLAEKETFALASFSESISCWQPNPFGPKTASSQRSRHEPARKQECNQNHPEPF